MKRESRGIFGGSKGHGRFFRLLDKDDEDLCQGGSGRSGEGLDTEGKDERHRTIHSSDV